MSVLGLALSLHVIVAILGCGLVSGLLIVALNMDGSEPAATWVALDRIRRTVGVSLGVVLASGVLLEYLAGGPFHGTIWFRTSFFLLLVVGALNGVAGRAIRKKTAATAPAVVRLVRAAASAMCAVVATLMELKPW